jgi:hypothetical protein
LFVTTETGGCIHSEQLQSKASNYSFQRRTATAVCYIYLLQVLGATVTSSHLKQPFDIDVSNK